MPAARSSPALAARAYSRHRLRLGDGRSTTLHVARFPRASTRVRVVATRGRPLLGWCREEGVRDAIVGGFFVRPAGTPLGDARIAGGPPEASAAFDEPWDRLRSCVHVDGDVRIVPRWALPAEPRGDLLQAGPRLVCGGAPAIVEGVDPEGFSAGSRQFDSDITRGRYPRAALALTGQALLAVACDGRADDEAGLTLGELAAALVAAGACDAINLDGGGSASLVVGGRLRNRPREEHGIPLAGGRPIATALTFSAR
jgi:Phosphodiester glycosidase